MRIRIKTTSNEKILPFDYQGKLIGVIHKWLGNNELHDKISLYSFSWLLGGVMVDKKGYVFPNGAELLISFHEDQHLKKIIDSINNIIYKKYDADSIILRLCKRNKRTRHCLYSSKHRKIRFKKNNEYS